MTPPIENWIWKSDVDPFCEKHLLTARQHCIDLILSTWLDWRIFHFTQYTLYLMNFHILQFWVHWCICLWPFLGSIKKFYGYDYWQSNIKNYVVPNFQNKKIGKFYLLCTIYKVLVLWDHTYICWFGSCIHSLV